MLAAADGVEEDDPMLGDGAAATVQGVTTGGDLGVVDRGHVDIPFRRRTACFRHAAEHQRRSRPFFVSRRQYSAPQLGQIKRCCSGNPSIRAQCGQGPGPGVTCRPAVATAITAASHSSVMGFPFASTSARVDNLWGPVT